MNLFELFLLAIGLSMDAFAVSICKGLSMKKSTVGKCSLVGFYFGFFQGAMPVLGYILGVQFRGYITSIDHWIAFILLGLIGANMIKEALDKNDECCNGSLDFRTMIMLGIATSIDALAVGITFAFLNVNILTAASFIGIVTFVCSFLGVKIGSIFGAKFRSKAGLAGGIILILMGSKILLEHLGILG